MNNIKTQNRINRICNWLAILLAAVVLLSAVGRAQTVSAATTLSGAVTAGATQWCLASATGVVTPSLSAAAPSGSILVAGTEAAQVTGAGVSATCFRVRRGQLGSRALAHGTGIAVWVLSTAASSGDTSRPFVVGLTSGTFSPYTAYTTISPASGVAGTSTSQIAGSTWFSQLYIPGSTVLTGACVRNGATVTTDKYIVALYSGEGTLLANSALAGAATAGVSLYQCVAFTALYAIAPGSYFVAIQTNGTTDNFLVYAAGGAPTNYATGSKTGTFGTLTAITPVVAFEAGKGPQMMVY